MDKFRRKARRVRHTRRKTATERVQSDAAETKKSPPKNPRSAMLRPSCLLILSISISIVSLRAIPEGPLLAAAAAAQPQLQVGGAQSGGPVGDPPNWNGDARVRSARDSPSDSREPPDEPSEVGVADGKQLQQDNNELLLPAGSSSFKNSESNGSSGSSGSGSSNGGQRKLKILRVDGPSSVQNGTQNVTLDCIYKFDPKLDQRLIVKWFFENELEPVYQWIPELNERVFSDKFEKFIDREYDLGEDLELLLEAYKQKQLARQQRTAGHEESRAIDLDEDEPEEEEPEELAEGGGPANVLGPRQPATGLAARLAKLAKMGGPKSRQLLELLRHSHHLEPLELTRFRALRLIRPTSELSGRFTCSVSSLDAQDLAWRQLTIFEPAHKFEFSVRKVSESQYNLSCSAEHVFPRPSLSLYRQLAGPVAAGGVASAGQQQLQEQQAWPGRPRGLAAAAGLRREPISSSRTQTHVSISSNARDPKLRLPDATLAEPIQDSRPSSRVSYDAAVWSLLEDSSLAGSLVSHFECVLQISPAELEATSSRGRAGQSREPLFEARRSLAINRGWHLNSAALVSSSSLLSFFTILASLLALALAIVSALFLLRLFQGHASKSRGRVHECAPAAEPASRPSSSRSRSSSSSNSSSGLSPASAIVALDSHSNNNNNTNSNSNSNSHLHSNGKHHKMRSTAGLILNHSTDGSSSGSRPNSPRSRQADESSANLNGVPSVSGTLAAASQLAIDPQMEGAYRVPIRAVMQQQHGPVSVIQQQQQRQEPSLFVADLYQAAANNCNSQSAYSIYQQTKRSPILFIAQQQQQQPNQSQQVQHQHQFWSRQLAEEHPESGPENLDASPGLQVVASRKAPTFC